MPERLPIDLQGRLPEPSGQPVHRTNGAKRAKAAQPVASPSETPPLSSPERGIENSPKSDGAAGGENAFSDASGKLTKSPSRDLFRRFAHKTSASVGSPWAFALAGTTIVVWGLTGPIFHFSDTWQLVINTSTTIVTFLMVFLIQNTQNRDAAAIHLKLNELIRALKGARNQLVDLEELSDEDLEKLHREFRRLSAGNLGAHPDVRRQRP